MPGMMGKGPMGKAPMPPAEDDIDSLMGEDIAGGEEEPLFDETPLEMALKEAGINVTPEKLSRIQAILSEPEKGKEKPGSATAPTPPVGGMVPEKMPAPGAMA